eukprot:SAG11_NODE_1771_length_4273_cov_25.729756_2_plen_117_part_00
MNAAASALVEVAKYLDRVEYHGVRGMEHAEVWHGVELVQPIAFTIPRYCKPFLRKLSCLRHFRYQFRRGEYRQLSRNGLYVGRWVEDEEELYEIRLRLYTSTADTSTTGTGSQEEL